MIRHAGKKKEIESLDELPFPDSRAWTSTKLLKQYSGEVLLIALSLQYTEHSFPSIYVGVRWQDSFYQGLKKSYIKEWEQSRPPIPNLAFSPSFSQYGGFQLKLVTPAQDRSTGQGQHARGGAQEQDWRAWPHVASASDLIQALGQGTAQAILNQLCLCVPLKEGLWGLMFLEYFSDGHQYMMCDFPLTATNSPLHAAVTPGACVSPVSGRNPVLLGWLC